MVLCLRYEIVEPPPDYVVSVRPSLPLAAAAVSAATPFGGATPLYSIPDVSTAPRVQDLPGFTKELEDVTLKAEDYQVFSKLFTDVSEEELTHEEIQERKIAALLLKIKNGAPPIRRAALKQITERVSSGFGIDRRLAYSMFYLCAVCFATALRLVSSAQGLYSTKFFR